MYITFNGIFSKIEILIMFVKKDKVWKKIKLLS